MQNAIGETDRHLRLVADAQHDIQQVALLLDDFEALWEVLAVEERRELLIAAPPGSSDRPPDRNQL